MTVAALYIDLKGPYPKLARGEYLDVWPPGKGPVGLARDIDCWDASRDARLYDGPHPVVAHPPCTHYGRVKHLGKANDSDCAIVALEQVRRFGGVLEHPAESRLWWLDGTLSEHIGRFGQHIDAFGGRSVAVEQVMWGHACRKRTWLYLVGVPDSALEHAPFPTRKPTHWCSGGRTGGSRQGSPIPPGIKAASAQIKRRTPPLFAEYLIRLARAAGAARRAA